MKANYTTLIIILFTNLWSYAQNTVHQENFTTGLGTWSQVNMQDATDIWTNNGGFLEMNGFGGGNDEDWLISPAINLDNQSDEYLLFDYNDGFNGPLLEIYYSTNYNGGSTALDVQTATWNPLNSQFLDINALSCFSTLYQRHPAIDISSITGTTVYFAFRYQGQSSLSKRYRIDNIRILSDYYNGISTNVSCCALKTALHQLINQQSVRIEYSSSIYDVWDALLHTDQRNNDAGTTAIMWDMFTDFPTTTGEFEFDPCASRDRGSCTNLEGACYNREHTFPKSWWGGGTGPLDTAYTDMHHITPSDRFLNSAKSNFPPGVVLTPSILGTNGVKIGTNSNYPCSSMEYFEPIDEYKGDYARMYFYMLTRYQHQMANWEGRNTRGDCALNGDPCTGVEPWLLEVLLEWHHNDPVSAKEVNRNNAVYSIQGNRNPFIDQPSWVEQIWGDHLGNACNNLPSILNIENLEVFTGQVLNPRQIQLHWTYQMDREPVDFILQRSSNGYSWTNIASIASQVGQNQYPFLDESLAPGSYYYRLKVEDQSRSQQYSQLIHLQIKSSSSMQPYPNPVKNELLVEQYIGSDRKIQLYNSLGVLALSTELKAGNTALDLSFLPKGLYVLYIETNEAVQHYSIIKD